MGLDEAREQVVPPQVFDDLTWLGLQRADVGDDAVLNAHVRCEHVHRRVAGQNGSAAQQHETRLTDAAGGDAISWDGPRGPRHMVWIALAGLALAQEEAAVDVAPAPLPLPLVFSEDHTWVEGPNLVRMHCLRGRWAEDWTLPLT